MMSKNSFWVSMRENNKRRLWLWIISALFWFFYYPIAMVMVLSRTKNIYEDAPELFIQKKLLAEADSWLGSSEAQLVFVTLFAVVCAIQGFSYLYSRKKVDLYHSMPVSKTRRFMAIYLNGVMMWLIPTMICRFLAVLVAGANGAVNGEIVQKVVISFLLSLILYMGIYGLTVLAVMLTGNFVITLFATAILLAYELAAIVLFRDFQENFFTFFSYNSETRAPIFSPIYEYWKAADILFEGVTSGAGASGFICKGIFLAILFGGLAYFCYCRRPSEAAGKTMAFSKTKPVIKILLATLFSLGAISVIRDIISAGREESGNITVLLLLMAAAAVILSNCVIEVIYEQDIRAALGKKRHIIITGVCVALIYGIFRFDLAGYDDWTPKADNLQGAWVINQNNYHQSFFDKKMNYVSASEYCQGQPMITDLDAICELTQKKTEKINENTISCDVAYKLKNGKVVWRTFGIDNTEEKLLNKIIGSDEYKRAAYQIYDDEIFDMIEQNSTREITCSTGLTVENLPDDELELIRELYIKDLENADYSLFKNEFACGMLSITAETDDYYNNIYFEYPIYPSFSNMIDYLEEKEINMTENVKAEDIEAITVTNNHYEFSGDSIEYYDGDRSVTKTFEDEKQIEELVGALYPIDLPMVWKENELSQDYYVIVKLKSGVKNSNYYRGESTFLLVKDEIPQWLEAETAYK